MSPEPEDLVDAPKPSVQNSPLEGTEDQSALAADEVVEATVVEVDEAMVEVVTTVELEDEAEMESEVVAGTGAEIDARLVEVDESHGQT